MKRAGGEVTRGEAILFAVRDDGTGIDPEFVARRMGLDIMQDRMEALGGTLEVASSPWLGTTVTGRVPTRVVESVGS
ncbi:MAG TPA: ATP-binding protein [Actinomycetota bacterium]|nr:ATP-binding protein [Actinomycetota bacterium]